MSDSPNALYDPKCQKPEVTVTWFVRRYPPATAIPSPRKNSPIPPLVPPAP
jgi:hypothetical protein